MDVVKAAMGSPISAAFAAATADVVRKIKPRGQQGQVQEAVAVANANRLADQNFVPLNFGQLPGGSSNQSSVVPGPAAGRQSQGATSFDASIARALFTSDVSTTQGGLSKTASILEWIALACGRATRKKVRAHVHVGEIPPDTAVTNLNPATDVGMTNADLRTYDVAFFINYTMSQNSFSASFAIAHLKGTFAVDQAPSVVWTVFAAEKPSIAYKSLLMLLEKRTSNESEGVCWMEANYHSLAALVNDLLAHLMYNGRPEDAVLWSGGDARRAVTLAGMSDLKDNKVFATIAMLNAKAFSQRRGAAGFVDTSTPRALPPHVSRDEYENMYAKTDQTDVDRPKGPKRTNKSPWASKMVAFLKSMDTGKVPQPGAWAALKSLVAANTNPEAWLKIVDQNIAGYRVDGTTKVDASKWVPSTILQDMSHIVLGTVQDLSGRDSGDAVPDEVTGVWGEMDQAIIDRSFNNQDDSSTALLQALLSNTMFFAIFLHLSTVETIPKNYAEFLKEGGALSDFLPLAVAYAMDNFIDMTWAETELAQSMASQAARIDRGPTVGPVSRLMAFVVDFIMTNKASLGLVNGPEFVSLEEQFASPANTSAQKKVFIGILVRVVALSALMNMLAHKTGTSGGLFNLPLENHFQTLVSRLAHCTVKTGISGNRRGSTIARAATEILRGLGKMTVPTADQVASIAAPLPAQLAFTPETFQAWQDIPAPYDPRGSARAAPTASGASRTASNQGVRSTAAAARTPGASTAAPVQPARPVGSSSTAARTQQRVDGLTGTNTTVHALAERALDQYSSIPVFLRDYQGLMNTTGAERLQTALLSKKAQSLAALGAAISSASEVEQVLQQISDITQ